MPAAIAFLMAAPSAPVFGSVTAMPSTFLSIAAWISCACLLASGSLEYCSSTLSFAEAASPPLRMMSQNVSPGAWWVVMATVIFGVFATPALAAEEVSVAFLPPDDEQAERASAALSATAANATGFERFIWIAFRTSPSRRCLGLLDRADRSIVERGAGTGPGSGGGQGSAPRR